MTDAEYGEDSQVLLIQIKLFEFMIDDANGVRQFSREAWDKELESFNVGREVLDRKFLIIFWSGGPRGINKRIRKSLVGLMLKIEKEYPHLKGENFDQELKFHLVVLAS